MNRNFVVAVMFLGILHVSAPVDARGGVEDIQKVIQEASVVLMDPSASSEKIQDALVRLLNSAVLLLPQRESAADVKSNLEAAVAELKVRSWLGEKARQHLSAAYRGLSSGKDFKFPEIHSIEEARTYLQNQLGAAASSVKKGEGSPAARLLLEGVIVVITPMPR
jgi:hypothetical protein